MKRFDIIAFDYESRRVTRVVCRNVTEADKRKRLEYAREVVNTRDNLIKVVPAGRHGYGSYVPE